jgi:GT2 family glycosyltransferase
MLDVIGVSELNNCINTLNNSSDSLYFNIIVMETNKTREFEYKQKNVKMIIPKRTFNYNAYCNIALEYCKNEFTFFLNNDVWFEKNCVDEMLKAFETDKDLYSATPYHEEYHGLHPELNYSKNLYGTSLNEMSWSLILIRKKTFDIIGKLDEQFEFWMQDADYAKTLNKYKLYHCLVVKAKAHHIGQATTNEFRCFDNLEHRRYLMEGMMEKFNKKWN